MQKKCFEGRIPFRLPSGVKGMQVLNILQYGKIFPPNQFSKRINQGSYPLYWTMLNST
jgi:hypothetical protein